MTISVGQTAIGRTAGAATQNTGDVTTAATGSTFVIWAVWYPGTFASVGDNKGNTYVPIDTGLDPFQGFWYCENGVGGAGHHGTITVSDSGALTVFLLEILGGMTSGILDKHTSAADAASPYTSGPTATTSQADELLVGVCAADSTAGNPYSISGATPPGGWTIYQEEDDSATFNAACIAAAVVSAIDAYEAGFAATGSTAGNVYIATFKAAAATLGIGVLPFGGSRYHPGRSPGLPGSFILSNWWPYSPPVVSTFDESLMAAMNWPWPNTVIVPPQVVASGMTPSDNVST